MRRTDLTAATMQGWARLDPLQRDRFFDAFLNAALRLDWLELRNPPIAGPIDPAPLNLGCGCRPHYEGGWQSCHRVEQRRGEWWLDLWAIKAAGQVNPAAKGSA